MKKTLQSMVLVIVSASAILSLSACQPAGPPTNPAATANTNVAKDEPLDVAAIEKELLELERQWGQAVVNRNVDFIRRIEADDIAMTYIDGSTGTKADDIRDIESGALTAEAWDLADLKVRVLSANSAVVTGRGIIKNGKYKGADGRVQTLKPQYRFTDVFAKRNGQWQVVASQATTILNPGQAAPAPPSPAPASSPSPGSPAP